MNIFDTYYEEANYSLIINKVIDYIRDVKQNNPYHKYNLLEHTEHVVKYLQSHGADSDLILAGWLHDVGKVATKTVNPKTGVDNFLGHAEAGVEWIEKNFPQVPQRVKDLVANHDRVSEIGKIKTLLHLHDDKWIEDLFLLREADAFSHSDFGREEQMEQFAKQRERFNKIKMKEQLNASQK